MEIKIQFLLFSFSILIFFSISTQSANSCKPESCGGTPRPEVRFPFRLSTGKSDRCGYPGFELSCNSRKETILKLPAVSDEFRVNSIDYSSQILSMNYMGSCLSSGILQFNLSGSPFRQANVTNYIFLNCSSWEEVMTYASAFDFKPIPCLSGSNFTILAKNSLSPDQYAPPMCRRIANVLVPAEFADAMGSLEEIDLLWRDPGCSYCEKQGRACGFMNESSLGIGCYKRASSGISRRAKYGLIIGIGIPGLVCIIGLVSHTCGLIKLLCLRRSPNSELPTVTVPDGQLGTNGLDMPTIDSYPKKVLDRLPESSDGTCPICLSEYQPKDTVRSIPECNHYFHVDCIDEWLKLNGSCPVCRNSPDGSTATPCSSLSSLSSVTPLSTQSSGNLNRVP